MPHARKNAPAEPSSDHIPLGGFARSTQTLKNNHDEPCFVDKRAASARPYDVRSHQLSYQSEALAFAKTIESLLELGLSEAGPNARHYGQIGWRLTDDGWRCMYGETIAEILAKPDGVKSFPFVVWKWPVDPNGARRRFQGLALAFRLQLNDRRGLFERAKRK